MKSNGKGSRKMGGEGASRYEYLFKKSYQDIYLEIFRVVVSFKLRWNVTNSNLMDL